jgi:hypothetical protein
MGHYLTLNQYREKFLLWESNMREAMVHGGLSWDEALATVGDFTIEGREASNG